MCVFVAAKAMARGNFKKCRVLLGSNTNEGHYFIIYFLTNIFKKQVRLFFRFAGHRANMPNVIEERKSVISTDSDCRFLYNREKHD